MNCTHSIYLSTFGLRPISILWFSLLICWIKFNHYLFRLRPLNLHTYSHIMPLKLITISFYWSGPLSALRFHTFSTYWVEAPLSSAFWVEDYLNPTPSFSQHWYPPLYSSVLLWWLPFRDHLVSSIMVFSLLVQKNIPLSSKRGEKCCADAQVGQLTNSLPTNLRFDSDTDVKAQQTHKPPHTSHLQQQWHLDFGKEDAKSVSIQTTGCHGLRRTLLADGAGAGGGLLQQQQHRAQKSPTINSMEHGLYCVGVKWSMFAFQAGRLHPKNALEGANPFESGRGKGVYR